jgi:hypothetical protein
MLQLIHLEEIHTLLLSVPDLYDQLERRDAKLLLNSKKWLLLSENICKNYRLSITSNISGLRGLLISAERGVKPKEIELVRESTKRKIVEAAIAYCIKTAVELITSTIKKDQDRIDEAERIMMRIVTIGITKGLIHARENGESNSEYLKKVWTNFSLDPDISGGVTNVISLAGPNDSLIIFDRVLCQYT